MFHVEHNAFIKELKRKLPLLTQEQGVKLLCFAESIHEYNKKFNITGLTSIQDIINILIIKSISPVENITIDPGSFYVDIGSGSGIPGIPIGIYHDNASGLLVDSNEKKYRFISMMISKLGLINLSAQCSRIEDLGNDPVFREKGDWVFSRALGNVFLTVELGAPLLRCGGYLYIYSETSLEKIYSGIIQHACSLGLTLMDKNVMNSLKISQGLLFKKINNTDTKYPRRFSVIKRESKKFDIK